MTNLEGIAVVTIQIGAELQTQSVIRLQTLNAVQPLRDTSLQGLMRMMMADHNVTAEVCAIYLPGMGADASVLLDGVTPAAPMPRPVEFLPTTALC